MNNQTNPLSLQLLALSARLSDLSNKIMKDPRTKNALGFAVVGVLAAVAFSFSQDEGKPAPSAPYLEQSIATHKYQLDPKKDETLVGTEIATVDGGGAASAWADGVMPSPEWSNQEKLRGNYTEKTFLFSSGRTVKFSQNSPGEWGWDTSFNPTGNPNPSDNSNRNPFDTNSSLQKLGANEKPVKEVRDPSRLTHNYRNTKPNGYYPTFEDNHGTNTVLYLGNPVRMDINLPVFHKDWKYDPCTILTFKYKGELKVWNVRPIPPQSKSVTLSFKWNLTDFESKDRYGKPGKGAAKINPGFGTKNGPIQEIPNNLYLSSINYGQPEKVRATFPIPENATHFIIRPGFDAGDRGKFQLSDLEITFSGQTADEKERKNTRGIPGGQDTPSGNLANEQELLLLINQERANTGLEELAPDNSLQKAARFHAQDMAEEGYFSHDSKDPIFQPTFTKEGKAIGETKLFAIGTAKQRHQAFQTQAIAENIAKDASTAQDALTIWMMYPATRANLLSKSAKTIGIGFNKDHWVLDFGKE